MWQMKLSSLYLEAFFAVSKCLNFSKAAKSLHITQSALSQRVLKLEDHLGAKLFIRDPAGIRLTETGDLLLRYCQTQSALEDELLSKVLPRMAKNPAGLGGTIRIGGFSSVLRSLVMPRLDSLVSKNPNIKVEIFVREMPDLPGLLRQGQADFIVLDRFLEDSDLASHKLGEEENVLVESKNGSLREHVYLDHDSDDKTTLRFHEAQGKKMPEKFARSYLDDIYGILDGAAMGWGRAVVPLHLLEGRRDLRVVKNFKSLKTPVVLHYYKQPYYSELFNQALTCLEVSKPRLGSSPART
jgi:DNA-binding transcriptional LysR family regulator